MSAGQNPALAAGLDATISAIDLVPITPDDNADLTTYARAIRCKPTGSAGTLRITTATGQTRNTSIALGEVLMVQVAKVHQTGTTATGLEAMI